MKTLNKSNLAAVLVAMVLAACGSKVPDIKDPKNPVVEGKAMTPSQFLERFCQGVDRAAERSCTLVLAELRKGLTAGEMPKW